MPLRFSMMLFFSLTPIIFFAMIIDTVSAITGFHGLREEPPDAIFTMMPPLMPPPCRYGYCRCRHFDAIVFAMICRFRDFR
jgi:hypothetical protein